MRESKKSEEGGGGLLKPPPPPPDRIGLTVGECSIFVRNTMLHIRSMSNNLRMFYQS